MVCFQITVHPSYNFPDNDIAILELDGVVIQSSFARTVCLPNGETPKDGEICYATGFGTTSTFNFDEKNFKYYIELNEKITL